MVLLSSFWNADALWNFRWHKSRVLDIAGRRGRFETVARAPRSWFSTFCNLSFCSWSLPSVVFFFLFIATTMSLKLHSLGPCLILQIFCCGSLWNQSGPPALWGGSWAAREFDAKEMEAPRCSAIPSRSWWEQRAPRVRGTARVKIANAAIVIIINHSIGYFPPHWGFFLLTGGIYLWVFVTNWRS